MAALVARRPYGAQAASLPLLTGLRPELAEQAAKRGPGHAKGGGPLDPPGHPR